MRLIDIVSGPWAIMPEMLDEITGIYATHLRGEKIDIAKVEAALGRPLANSRIGSEDRDGVAIISMHGAIAKRMNLMSEISGGTSSQLAANDFETALNKPDIKGIILNIDSPGGTVDGTAELASKIHASRGKKPIIAYSDGMIASAAYWIASAADAIYISGNTNPVGSIGVVSAHKDFSKAEEKAGVKTTEITAGKYKRIASQFEPLNDDGRAEMQEKVDYLYSAFVDSVAAHRGVSVDQVLSSMADGKVFLGQQAIDAGLVDGVSTIENIIEAICNPDTKKLPKRKAFAGVAESIEEQEMTIEQLKEKHADLVDAIKAEATEGMVTHSFADYAIKDAVDANTTRICSLVSATMGEETAEKLTALIETGLTASQATALNIRIEPESATVDKESRAAILAGLQAAAPAGLSPARIETDEMKSLATSIADGANKNIRR